MKRLIPLSICAGLLSAAGISAQNDSNLINHRPYRAMARIYHPEDSLSEDIREAFERIPVSDNYNSLNIDIRIIDNDSIPDVRKRSHGLVKAQYGRSLSAEDVRLNGEMIQRILNQANMAEGLNSNHNNFLLVNDITYVTADERAQAAKVTMNVVGGIMGVFTDKKKNKSKSKEELKENFTAFTVRTHSYLYQLQRCDSDSTALCMKFVGHEYEYDGQTALKGRYEHNELVKMVCTRSIDKNIAAIQREYEPFRIISTVHDITKSRNKIVGYSAHIGMREGVNELSHFCVVEPVHDTLTNTIIYKQRAELVPVKGQIWDNRYNAVTEQAAHANIGFTTFKLINNDKHANATSLEGLLLIENINTTDTTNP